MFKSPLLRKVTFELFPAALLSLTGSILVAQYFRPAVVITPPSNEAAVREDLIRALKQERTILLDEMARIAATNAVAPSIRPVSLDATASPREQRTNPGPNANQVSQPRPQIRTNAVATQTPDDTKKLSKTKPDQLKSETSLPLIGPAIDAPITLVPQRLPHAEEDQKISALDVVSRPFEKTKVWFKTLKSRIVDQFSIEPTDDTQKFSGRGIY